MNSYKKRLRFFFIILVAVILGSSFAIMYTENISFPDAVYYTLVTISTVGYGDIHPTTGLGKIVAVILIITGVGTFLGVIGNATELMISREEAKNRKRKIHILSGLFFSEIGNTLLRYMVENDGSIDETRKFFQIRTTWQAKDYELQRNGIKKLKINIDPHESNYLFLEKELIGNKDFMVRMLENPAMMEGEGLTELLREIFHLYEEFSVRLNSLNISESDRFHINNDLSRTYRRLMLEWINYMEYLHLNFPGLFGFNKRNNPFRIQTFRDNEIKDVIKKQEIEKLTN